MSDDGKEIDGIVFDTTVLSNYAASDSVGFLASTFSNPMTVTAVQEELEQGVEQGRPFLERTRPYIVPSTDPQSSAQITVRSIYQRTVQETADEIQALDYGESHALTFARYFGHALATDDMQARTVANDFDVPCTGSLGVLVRGIEREEISVAEAEAWHTTWVENNSYYSPIDSVSELL